MTAPLIVALLAWPDRRREVVLVVEANRMVDFAERNGRDVNEAIMEAVNNG